MRRQVRAEYHWRYLHQSPGEAADAPVVRGDPPAVGGHGEDIGDDEDADTPGEGAEAPHHPAMDLPTSRRPRRNPQCR